MTEVRTHAALIELTEPLPQDVVVGGDFVVKLKMTCAEGCDMRALPVCLSTSDAKVGPIGSDTRDTEDGAREITISAPRTVGEHAWNVALAADAIAGVVHAAAPLPIGVNTKPHGTSLAVWDIPSPAVIGTRFEIKIGAKSSSDCDLAGRTIEVCNDSGTRLAEGRLGPTPWPGTTGLYWTTIELYAPAEAGAFTWTVRFAATEHELPHEGAAADFSFAAARPPEHRLTVKVVSKETAAPIDEAHIRLGAFRAMTGPSGQAVVELPKGTYDLTVWKAGFEVPDQSLQIDADLSLHVEAVTLPEEDAIWQM